MDITTRTSLQETGSRELRNYYDDLPSRWRRTRKPRSYRDQDEVARVGSQTRASKKVRAVRRSDKRGRDGGSVGVMVQTRRQWMHWLPLPR